LTLLSCPAGKDVHVLGMLFLSGMERHFAAKLFNRAEAGLIANTRNTRDLPNGPARSLR
jgi:hypothetical protein